MVIKDWFGLELAHRSFTPDHSTPLRFLADAFLHPGRDVAAWACRSGGKTLCASILAALEFMFTDDLQARVLAGSEDQGRCLYEYWLKWCRTVLAHRLQGDVKRLLTRVGGGRFEILAASHRKVRGPKVQRLYEDELDEIDADIDSAAVGMIASAPLLPARTIYTSTWHRIDGTMARLVARAPDCGVSMHKWNLWEAIERCPAERHDAGRGCEHCELAPACRQKARDFHDDPDWPVGIAAEAGGLYAIDDAVKAYRKVSLATWEAEFLCKRPAVVGRVYDEFDEGRHRLGLPPGGGDPPADLKIYRSIDWGHGVFVCLWIGEDKDGTAYLLDTYRAEHGTIHQHAEHIKAHPLGPGPGPRAPRGPAPRGGRIAGTFCDPAGRNRSDQTGRSNVEVFREYGINCTYSLSSAAREVRNGIMLVKAALAPASGRPRFFYLPTAANRIFVKAMQSYRNRRVNGIWIDQPQDPQEFEHIPDALRYFFVNRARGDRKIEVVQLGVS
ncbi:MAG: hypothetical protein ISS78_10235 [Phycisphaerae bacterium]|nr:hypothetical protein [Phycisphaerae bacterium]